MKVEQFYDEGLAHGSYAIVSENEIALVDPARDPQPYLDFAKQHNASVVAVFETHPHADFASSHLEFHEKYGATIYINPKVEVAYPHQPISNGEVVKFGKVSMKALFTPGHSPDHNAYLLLDEEGNPHSVYTGDALFVGDVGRPDLREGAGSIHIQREDLAQMMYHTVQEVFKPLQDDILVYPAHGAGSLCGKNMSTDTFSTIGREKTENWAFQVKNENSFVKALLEDQPFVPKYFPYDVEINRQGVASLEESLQAVPRLNRNAMLDESALIIDTRPQQQFKAGHVPGAINIQDGGKFETWLGAVVAPEEKFYLIAENEEVLEKMIRKTAKIGYEKKIKGALLNPGSASEKSPILESRQLAAHPEQFTIVDIRNKSESAGGKFFGNSINIPLHELRERAGEISTEQPIVVHCAGGYRSAIGASIVRKNLNGTAKVYDLGKDVEKFKK
jgi:hydroxyacylglutathione hydrolase